MEVHEYFWLILPLIVIQFTLLLIAIIDWYRQGATLRKEYWWWLPIILFISIIGPVLYFLIGRRNDT